MAGVTNTMMYYGSVATGAITVNVACLAQWVKNSSRRGGRTKIRSNECRRILFLNNTIDM